MCKAEKVCWSIAAVSAFFVIGPFVFEGLFEPLGNARFAGVLIGLMTGLTAAISSGLFKARGRAKARLLKGQNLLADWTYTSDEWKSYAGEDSERERSGKWRLFAIVAFWCVLFGIVFPIFDNEAGWWVTAIMAVLLAVIAVVIVVTTRARSRRLHRRTGEVRIADDALWLSGELHVWKGWGARLERVEVVNGTPNCLAITYSTPSRYQRQETTVNVPIPRDKHSEAAALAARLLEHRAG